MNAAADGEASATLCRRASTEDKNLLGSAVVRHLRPAAAVGKLLLVRHLLLRQNSLLRTVERRPDHATGARSHFASRFFADAARSVKAARLVFFMAVPISNSR